MPLLVFFRYNRQVEETEWRTLELIGATVQELMMENKEDFLLPADNVATVMANNPLDHALLVLSKVGYSKIPVTDKEDRLVGLIGLNDIVGKMIDLTRIDTDNLAGMTVADVMQTQVDTVTDSCDLEDILHLLVDNAFLPIVDEDRHFVGIVTRKEILKSTNHLCHELERRYLLTEKESYRKEVAEAQEKALLAQLGKKAV